MRTLCKSNANVLNPLSSHSATGLCKKSAQRMASSYSPAMPKHVSIRVALPHATKLLRIGLRFDLSGGKADSTYMSWLDMRKKLIKRPLIKFRSHTKVQLRI
jgi:hypothetical protein